MLVASLGCCQEGRSRASSRALAAKRPGDVIDSILDGDGEDPPLGSSSKRGRSTTVREPRLEAGLQTSREFTVEGTMTVANFWPKAIYDKEYPSAPLQRHEMQTYQHGGQTLKGIFMDPSIPAKPVCIPITTRTLWPLLRLVFAPSGPGAQSSFAVKEQTRLQSNRSSAQRMNYSRTLWVCVVVHRVVHTVWDGCSICWSSAT